MKDAWKIGMKEIERDELTASPVERLVICSGANLENCVATCSHVKPHVGTVCDVEEYEILETLDTCPFFGDVYYSGKRYNKQIIYKGTKESYDYVPNWDKVAVFSEIQKY